MKFKLIILILLCWNLTAPAQDFYDIETVNTIEIEFDSPYWDEILDSLYELGEGERLVGNAIINGEPFDSVGVRYKGYSTFDPDHIKNPFNIKLDYVIPDQNIDGYVTLKLSNGISDPSFLREVMGYEIARQYTPASYANYMNVYINGVLMGLFINIQSVDEIFAEEHFHWNDGSIFKGEVDDFHYLNQVWLYYGSNPSTYANLYEMKAGDSWDGLINFLDIFNNNPSEMEDVLDVDRNLWFIGLHNLIVHLDSPLVWARNYYLCEDINNRFNPVIWDLNMSFGVFNVAFGMGYLTTEDMQTLDPFFNSEVSNYAMIYNVLNDSTNRNMYIAHMKTIIQDNFADDQFLNRALEIQSIIDESVHADTNKYYPYEEFIQNVRGSTGVGGNLTIGLTELMDARVDYLLLRREFLASTPLVGEVNYSPSIVEPNSEIWFNAQVEDAERVILGYRRNYTDRFIKTEMFDDGLHNDGEADDGVYGVSIITGYSDLQYYVYCENAEAGIFTPERAEYEYFTLPILGGLCVNEFMADNAITAPDPQNEFDDWIEIFNRSDEAISLSGYYLTDNFSITNKWAFPDTVIGAGEFILIWADGDTGDYGLHTNFSLNKDGERIGLYHFQNEEFCMVDQIEFGAQEEDISFGRSPDGSENWASMEPTPGWGNGTTAVSEYSEVIPAGFYLRQNYPNPFNSSTVIVFNLAKSAKVSLTVFDVNGRETAVLLDGYKSAGLNEIRWDAENVSSGIYFVRLMSGSKSETLKLLLVK